MKKGRKKKFFLCAAFAAAVAVTAAPLAAPGGPANFSNTVMAVETAPSFSDLMHYFNPEAGAPGQVPEKWSHFLHGTPYYKYDTAQGLETAAQGVRGIDLDWRVTKDGVIANVHDDHPLQKGYRDPAGLIAPDAKIEDLTWAEVSRLRAGPNDEYKIDRAETQFALAAKLGVRVEFEAKNSPAFTDPATWQKIRVLADRNGLLERGLIQVKTISGPAAPARLKAAQDAGFTTILLPRGDRELSKKDYWLVTDYVRGPAWWR